MPEHDRAAGKPPSDALATAIDAVRHNPDSRAKWDLVEELVDGAQRPSDVRALFRDVLQSTELEPTVASDVGLRAVRFYENWYGEDSSELAELLQRVLARDEHAEWAFERLTVAWTAAERWDDLLAAYDTQIAREQVLERRRKLLDDAAQLAKDFAAQPDRAIGYMTQQFALEPENAALANALERLLERQGRWQDMITLWRSRAATQPVRQQRDTYLRMASCYMDALHDPVSALRELEQVLGEAPDYKPALDLAERILAAPGDHAAERRHALRHLREYHVRNQRPAEVIRVLELALSFASSDERRGLLRELVERAVDQRDDARAVVHQASLLVLEPLPKERDALRALIERTRNYDQYASALADAAEACDEPSLRVDMWLETARLREERLGQPESAIEFYSRVFRAEVNTDSTLKAGRRLLALLEQTDRERETLEVLARLSELEPTQGGRKTLLGKLAQLAERLGDHKHVRRAWGARLNDDAHDIEALAALIRASERDNDFAALANLLRQRTRAPGAAHQRREDLIALARVQEEKLRDVDSAIATWRELRASFGDDQTAVAALTDLLSRVGRWDELADVLRQAAQGEVQRFTELQSQLGDAYRERLDKPELAVICYRSALQVDPAHAGARAGQHALLAVPACRALAVASLTDAYRQTGEWKAGLALHDVRLELADSDAARAELWSATAREHELRGLDPERALESYWRAFTLAPHDRETEREIRRLAAQLDRWDAVVGAYRETIVRLVDEKPRMAELRYAEGQTLETRLSDRSGALDAYVQASHLAPDREEFASAAARLAVELGQWDTAATELLNCAAAKDSRDAVPFAKADEAADAKQAWDAWCAALDAGLRDRHLELSMPLRRELLLYLASLQRDRRGDLAATEDALLRAADAGAPDRETLRQLTTIQRTQRSPRLLASLRQLAELERDNLDPLWEAAELASEPSDAQAVLELLYERAVSAWRRGPRPVGQRTAQAAAAFAVERLRALYRAQKQPERALDLLIDATRLPFDGDTAAGFLRAAASLALELPGAQTRAIQLYRELLARDPRDPQALTALTKLYADADQLPELLALRRHELSLDVDAPAKGGSRSELRLEIVRLLGELSARGDRLTLLTQNLSEQPGHKPSLDALTTLLRARGEHAELARLLESQGRILAGQSQRAAAAALWREVAGLRESELN
ncbi:MAG: hypothetical protein ABW321_35625, partial [Polyangiales bacterium]